MKATYQTSLPVWGRPPAEDKRAVAGLEQRGGSGIVEQLLPTAASGEGGPRRTRYRRRVEGWGGFLNNAGIL